MKFGFRRQKEEQPKSTKQVAKREFNQEDIDNEMIRQAILRSAASTVQTKNVSESNTLPEGKQVGILLLPDTTDLVEFLTLYKKIEQSGIPSHLGIFNKTSGSWTEENLPE